MSRVSVTTPDSTSNFALQQSGNVTFSAQSALNPSANLSVDTVPSETAALSKYEYSPLESERTIRLLVTLPSDEGQLKFQIRHASLDESATVYAALSYVWGDKMLLHEISLDGRRFEITTNLLEALQSMRALLELGAMIWADAICINQNDIPERNKQVLLMRDIYQGASFVLVHLGLRETSEDVENAPALLRTLGSALNQRGDADVSGFQQRLPVADYKKYGLPERGDYIGWRPLRDFFNRPWFSRGWVLQEVVMARRVFAICQGWDRTMEFPKIVLLGCLATQWDLPILITPPTEQKIRLLFLFQFPELGGVKPGQMELLELLKRARSSVTTDPRDKIFAVVGISKEAEDPTLAPDYYEALDATLLRYARYFMQNDYGIDTLCACLAKDDGLDLPSWVPRWHTASMAESGSGILPFTDDGCCLTDDNNAVRVKGCIFETVVAVGNVLDDRDPNDDLFDITYSALSWIVDYYDLTSHMANPYPSTGEAPHEVVRDYLARSISKGWSPYKAKIIDTLPTWLEVLEPDEDCSESERGFSSQIVFQESWHRPLVDDSVENDSLDHRLLDLFWTLHHITIKQMMGNAKTNRGFVTSNGYLGSAYFTIRVGDRIMLTQSGLVPLVVREDYILAGGVQAYKLISGSNIRGFKASEFLREHDTEMGEIIII